VTNWLSLGRFSGRGSINVEFVFKRLIKEKRIWFITKLIIERTYQNTETELFGLNDDLKIWEGIET